MGADYSKLASKEYVDNYVANAVQTAETNIETELGDATIVSLTRASSQQGGFIAVEQYSGQITRIGKLRIVSLLLKLDANAPAQSLRAICLLDAVDRPVSALTYYGTMVDEDGLALEVLSSWADSKIYCTGPQPGKKAVGSIMYTVA